MKKSFFGDKDTSKERKQSASLGHIFDRQGTVVDQERKGVTLKVLANEIVLSDHPYVGIGFYWCLISY